MSNIRRTEEHTRPAKPPDQSMEYPEGAVKGQLFCTKRISRRTSVPSHSTVRRHFPSNIFVLKPTTAFASDGNCLITFREGTMSFYLRAACRRSLLAGCLPYTLCNR